MSREKRVSMRDVAEAAGVSVMTVSLALRNQPQVAVRTRNKVLRVAEQLGYLPDPALSALVGYRKGHERADFQGMVAYVNNTSRPLAAMQDDIHRYAFMGASRKAEELGYRLEEFWMKKPGLSPERSSEMLLERGIQGLVLGPQERHRGRIELDWPCFSAVAIGFSLEVPRLNVVSGETFYSMLICLRELATLGYHRIGLMIFDDHDDRVQNRFIGAYLAASENPPAYTLRLPILRTSAFTEKIFMDWFEQNHPDAVVGMTPLIPAYLERHGYSVPGDIGFASPFLAGDLSMYAHADDLPHEMGGLAMEMVSQMIDRNETGIPAMPRNLSVEPVWVPQHSVRRMGPSFPLQSA